MLKVGLTGNIGSGKSTVAAIFESLGIPVFYADKAAKELMYKNKALKQSIKSLLGPNAFYNNGRSNRSEIASIIFNDKKLLDAMNRLVHPAVGNAFIEWANSKDDTSYVMQEAAILFENGSFRKFDKNVLVTSPESLRIERVVRRDKTSKEKVLQRIRNQSPESELIPLADFVIENDGTKSLIL